MVIITLYNSKISLSLLIGVFRVTNPTVLFFLKFLRNYVSIIVNIIGNNTVLQCYLLWIFVSIRRVLQLIVCIGVSTPHLKNVTPSFAKSPLKSAKYPSPLFRGFTSPLPLFGLSWHNHLKITGCCYFFGFRGSSRVILPP